MTYEANKLAFIQNLQTLQISTRPFDLREGPTHQLDLSQITLKATKPKTRDSA